jgi:hypothetical protein
VWITTLQKADPFDRAGGVVNCGKRNGEDSRTGVVPNPCVIVAQAHSGTSVTDGGVLGLTQHPEEARPAVLYDVGYRR